MKVSIIGHSYVRDLKRFVGNQCSFLCENTDVNLNFIFIPGATFVTFLERPHILLTLDQQKPDVIIVILGGNDITHYKELKEVKHQCYTFFRDLRERYPTAHLIASQIELRFVKDGDSHKFGTPHFELFNKLSLHYNKWLNKQKFKDALLVIRGHQKLDNASYYRDSVHLNHIGLNRYWNLLKVCITNLCYKLNC